MSDAEIGNAIIAGIVDGDTMLEKMAEVVDHLRLAGFVIVPIDGTKPQCERCKDQGYYYRLPRRMNPFASSIEVTCREMKRIKCDCIAATTLSSTDACHK